MAGRNPMGDGYVEVNERIMAFMAKYPEGSLQADIYTLTDSLVVMKAYAFRTADDRTPGVGWSSLQIPGSTNFTRGSEIENCETSAWGRAIAALGFEVKRGIASKQEVSNKRQQKPAEPEKEGPSGHLLDEAVKQGAKPMCAEHNVEWIDNPKTGKRGHQLEGSTEYHVEEIK